MNSVENYKFKEIFYKSFLTASHNFLTMRLVGSWGPVAFDPSL